MAYTFNFRSKYGINHTHAMAVIDQTQIAGNVIRVYLTVWHNIDAYIAWCEPLQTITVSIPLSAGATPEMVTQAVGEQLKASIIPTPERKQGDLNVETTPKQSA